MSQLLKRHKRWCRNSRLDREGLCQELSNLPDKYFQVFKEYFKPTRKEFWELPHAESSAYWGSGLSIFDIKKSYAYTERRQNIVLLICAILDEL